MISLRQLVLIAVVIAAVWLFKRLQKEFMARAQQARKDNDDKLAYQDMVRCTSCGVYITRDDARGDAQKGYYCDNRGCLAKRNHAT